MPSLRIGLAQINSTVGDLNGNATKILHYIEEAKAAEVDLICFPELAITGYPPQDLLLKTDFICLNLEQLNRIIQSSEGITAIVGFADLKGALYNAAAVIYNGELAGVYHKPRLFNYGFFDETRYFREGGECLIFVINGANVGVNIGEDICSDELVTLQARAGAEVIVNISSCPYYAGKRKSWEKMLATTASDNLAEIAYTNLVGGQDELVFDGGSIVMNKEGKLLARGKQFEEDLVVVDLEVGFRRKEGKLEIEKGLAKINRILVSEAGPGSPKMPLSLHPIEVYDSIGEIYAALVLATRDYALKNDFEKVLVGLSGGIDSSLVAAIAVDALGPENVIGMAMPSRYSSEESKIDAQLLAKNLGIEIKFIPIEDAFQSYLSMLAPSFEDTKPNVAEENIQARIRGNILMALSNKFGWLVLTTGNRSETACGYCTLYGDMAGGFAVIKDVPKTLVYELAKYRNQKAGRGIIPQRVIEKEPSAELRPGQRDTDSLPPYEVLDPILEAYGEEKSTDQIMAMGFDRELVQRIISLVDRNEYKHRQAPLGIKITPRALRRERRLPITNRYRSL